MNAVPSRRELLAWALAIVLAVSVLVVSRPDDADAGVAGIDVAFISTGENFPDALGAGPAAALGIGPILLVGPNSIPDATMDELNRLKPQTIYIVGGTAVISPAVESQLEALSFSPTVTRLAGSNRYETAAEVSAEIFPHAGFLGAGDQAVDSDAVDGLHANELLRVAYDQSEDLPDADQAPFNTGTVGEGSVLIPVISAPTNGYLIITGNVNLSGSADDDLICGVLLDDVLVPGSVTHQTVVAGEFETCTVHGVETFESGSHTVEIAMEDVDSTTELGDGTASVLFVPFDGDGIAPAG